MAKRFSASVVIDAPAEQVWPVLTDISAYPDWDPNMVRTEGTIAPGNKVKFFTKLMPNRAFPVKVTELDENRRLVLTGGMPIPGLFKSERVYDLASVDGGTRMSLKEDFTGLMVPLFGRQIPDLNPIFEEFMQALKERVTQGTS